MEPQALSDREYERQMVQCLPQVRLYLSSFVFNQELDDLMQELSLRAWKYRSHFDGKNMTGWLVVIGRNLWFGLGRKSGRFIPVAPDEPLMFMVPDRAASPHERLECKQSLALLDKLSPEMRDALGDAILGLTEEEVVQKRGLKKGTVKSRVCRARMHMMALDGDSEARKELLEKRRARNARQNAEYRKRRKAAKERSVLELA